MRLARWIMLLLRLIPGHPVQYLRYEELIDGRFTDWRTIDQHSVLAEDDHIQVHVKVHSSGTLSFQAKEGRFKASYLVWWQSGP